ncbi:unnamed protein product [Schistosoma mattheei]|uniref:Ras modification protein ERF4 n=1 Tax=Schistosoma mattheei TaxID=31246 RepID=A0AA85BRX3_9TREM|nr:unnamed protein product [Schistosoma mattheei]
MGSEERPNNSMAPCERIFIQRDYSSGTAVRFQTLPMPLQLRGRIPPNRYADAIARLNKLFDEAETINSSVCLENLFGCLTAYLIFLCMKTHYDKVLHKVTLAVADLNEKLFLPNGLLMIDPSERGLRVIELCIFHSQ